MDSNTKVFKNKKYGEIRTVEINNERWLVGRDVLKILGYAENSKTIQRQVNINNKIKCIVKDRIGREQRVWVINKDGFIELMLKTKLEIEDDFKSWVMKEIFKQYDNKQDCNLDIIIKLSNQLKKEKEEKRLLQKQIEEYKQKQLITDTLNNNDLSVYVIDLIKTLIKNELI